MKKRPDSPVLVLGNGGFGTALALLLHHAGHRVVVWGNDPDYTRQIEECRENEKFLPGIPLPDEIRFSPDVRELAVGAEVIVSTVPTQFLRATLQRLSEHLPQKALVVSCSKGFERSTLELPSRLIRATLPQCRVGVLSGPSHAEEVGRRLPTTVVAAAETPEVASSIQALMNTSWFRAYTSSDPLGVEIAAATKNVIALAAGIAQGLGFGDNTGAALVCRGAAEITRLGVALGARQETFVGLSGIGDLIATSTSQHSRNRSVGLRLGKGETLAEILRSTE